MDVYLVQPRGFCAGVRRALEIVKQTLEQYGAPIYVRHEIVHNKHVIEDLKKQGVIFIDELSQITDSSRPVIFSAHGVPQSVFCEAEQKNLKIIDATCPLVNAVHQQVKKLEKNGAEVIVIGKAEHPEILGTVGQLKNPQQAHIVANLAEAKNLNIAKNTEVGLVTQTTLSVDETKEIAAYLKEKYPHLKNASQPNICFATTNRQKAVRELAQKVSDILIIGSKNSSNSRHLKEAALYHGAKRAWLIDDASEAPWTELDNCQAVGISAGASAPEYLTEELIKALQQRYGNINIYNVIVVEENISFK